MHAADVEECKKVLVPLTVEATRVDKNGVVWVCGGSEEMQYSSDFETDWEGRIWAKADVLLPFPEEAKSEDTATITGELVYIGGTPPRIELRLWLRNTVQIEAKMEIIQTIPMSYLYKTVEVTYKLDEHGYPFVESIRQKGGAA